jgi:hypothetical protein
MLVKFKVTAYGEVKKTEYGMKQIPRVGEFVRLDGFLSGYVKKVEWVLGDELGKPVLPRVVIHMDSNSLG